MHLPASARRLKYGIRRDVNGRAQLRRSDGTWMQCKLDMEVAGTMLLRDTNDGSVHVLQTDKLEQVRLAGWLAAAGFLQEQMVQLQKEELAPLSKCAGTSAAVLWTAFAQDCLMLHTGPLAASSCFAAAVQIDLSDDYLLLTLFADGEWQGQTQPIQLGDGDKLEPLQVEEQQFKDFVGMIKTLQVRGRYSHKSRVSAVARFCACVALHVTCTCG